MGTSNLVLFVSGKAAAGKDTLFNRLRQETFEYFEDEYIPDGEWFEFLKTGKNDKVEKSEIDTKIIHKIAFADEVKYELCRLNPEVDEFKLFNSTTYKEQFRKELVDIGDGYRKNDPLIWIKKHQERLIKYLDTHDGHLVVITDMRYINEFVYFEHMAKSMSENIFLSVRVECPLHIRLERMSKIGMINYVNRARYNDSEIQLDSNNNFDLRIDNSSEKLLDCMHREVKSIFGLWKKMNDAK